MENLKGKDEKEEEDKKDTTQRINKRNKYVKNRRMRVRSIRFDSTYYLEVKKIHTQKRNK